MKLKKFQGYLDLHSKDPRNFEKKVIFMGEQSCPGVFMTQDDLGLLSEKMPIVNWRADATNENFRSSKGSIMSQIHSDFAGEEFLPKSTHDRSSIRSLKFPIVGIDGDRRREFKTYHKFKKSEEQFPLFREKIVPVTRFDVIAHKNRPIHLQEKINSLGFDVAQERFKYLEEVENITEKLGKTYTPAFYHMSLLEADGRLYLENLDCSATLSPSQTIKMYETAYESFYETRLPVWFKKTLFENYVRPYYKTRYYDAALIKPKHSIDFEKYLHQA